MTRSILRFQPNAPVTVKLDRGPQAARETQSQISGETQYCHFVDDDAHVVYLSASAHAQLLKTGAEAGDLIRIVKLANGKAANWDIRVVPDAQHPEPPAPAPERQIRVVSSRNGSNGSYAANGATALAAQPQAQPVAHGVSYPVEDLLVRLFVTAGHALAKAHQQLKTEGFNLEPPIWDDVRACGLSLWIEHNKREAQR